MRRLIIGTVSAFLLWSVTVISVGAQTQPAGTQAGLKIAPTTYEATVTPGQPKDGVVDVFNLSAGPITVEPRIENIRMVGEAGDLEFFIGNNPFRLDSYVQLDRAAFTLGKGEARRVPFRITIPAGAPPGGYFGAVLFRTSPELGTKAGASVKQSGQVGTLLILTADGPADRRGSIEQIVINHPGASTKLSTVVTYANSGSTDRSPLGIAYKPRGSLTIRNVWGHAIVQQDVTGPVVFPGAQRAFSISSTKDFWFGPYTAEVKIAPGDGQTSSQTVTFWAISWPVLLIIIAVLVIVLAYVGVKNRKK